MQPSKPLAGKFALVTERLGPLPLVNHFIWRLGLIELLDQYVPTTDRRCAVPHATALGVLLRSIVVEREPIYRLGRDRARFRSGTVRPGRGARPRAPVIKLDDKGAIIEFIEKPKHFISDLAIIGIYFFKDGQNLNDELLYVIDKDMREKGEYQLTTAMEHMRQKGKIMRPGQVKEWLDCGK